MKIKEVKIGTINDSRGQKTIIISVNNCWTAAPSGKSKGKHEAPDYNRSIMQDFRKLKTLIEPLSKIEFNRFQDLVKIEKIIKSKVGANTLFALESSILKALAKEKGKELWQLLGGRKIPVLLSNIVGGGSHSHNNPCPDFQEFLVMGDKKHNTNAYNEVRKLIKAKGKNDENAWQTSFSNQEVLNVLKWDGKRGLDVAASEFYAKSRYNYKNKKAILTKQEQIDFIINLIQDYHLSYVEDPMQEDDFKGFAEILRATKGRCLIVGDDLTTTNLKRVQKAISMNAINGIIIKPNQIGSLIEVKKVIDLCKSKGIKTIMSHRSGETQDWTIADLAVGWSCDMIKIPVIGKERLAKVERLEFIKKKL